MGQTTRRKGTGLIPLFGPSRWTGPKGNLVQFPWPNSLRRNATGGSSVTPWIAALAGTNGATAVCRRTDRRGKTLSGPRVRGAIRDRWWGGSTARPAGFAPWSNSSLSAARPIFPRPRHRARHRHPDFPESPFSANLRQKAMPPKTQALGHRVTVSPCDPVPRSSFTYLNFPSTTIIRQVSSVGQCIQPAPGLLLSSSRRGCIKNSPGSLGGK